MSQFRMWKMPENTQKINRITKKGKTSLKKENLPLSAQCL